MAKDLRINKQDFVVKSNALVEARYRLSLQEMHVILWLLTQIKPDDEDFKVHRLDINEFSKMVGLKAKGQYTELQLITGNLMKRVLRIHEPEKQEIIQVSWLSSAKYQIKKGGVLLKFDPELKPYLLELKSHFTKINIVDTLKLKSIHAVRVFELLLQYLSVGQREIGIDELRQYCGIEKQEYKLYADLKRKVIEIAKREINTKTEYEVDYKENKESRRVASIIWTIKKRKPLTEQAQKLLSFRKELRSQESLVENLIEYGFSRPKAKHLVHIHQENVIKDAIRAVDIQIKRGHTKNPKAMLQVAIQEQWHPEKFLQKKT